MKRTSDMFTTVPKPDMDSKTRQKTGRMSAIYTLRSPCFGSAGFTLVEMLIVIIVLGILAMVVMPQLTASTDQANLKTLQTNLQIMRRAVETYYVQHDQTYPGKLDIYIIFGNGDSTASMAFVSQLTRYSGKDGEVSTEKDGTYKYGPYIKGGQLPINPFNGSNRVVCDFMTNDITVRASDGTSGWKFFVNTGVLIANDGGSTDGVVHDLL